MFVNTASNRTKPLKKYVKKKPTRNPHPLVREFLNLTHRERISDKDIAGRAGLGKDTIKDWRYRTTPNLCLFEAALNVLGYRLTIVKMKDESDE